MGRLQDTTKTHKREISYICTFILGSEMAQKDKVETPFNPDIFKESVSVCGRVSLQKGVH